MTSAFVARLCDQFWRQAGGPEPFPRDLTQSILWALPVSIVEISRLDIAMLEGWLQDHGFVATVGPQRRLHGCLVARGGHGFVFLDGTGSPDQRRFSLAHETGHFLVEHAEPRSRLLRLLGPTIQPALDGLRPLSFVERTGALLAGAPIELDVHLLERGPDGLNCGGGFAAECIADEVALELLAPEAAVMERLALLAPGRPYPEREHAAELLLKETFGLPDPIAGRYARRLLRLQTGGPSTREWLGIAGST